MTIFPSKSSLLSTTLAIALSVWNNPVWAGDPFRSQNARNIGDQTEAAFEAIFQAGNYPQAQQYLEVAEQQEGSEPLVYALQASLIYIYRKDNPEEFEKLKFYGEKTIEASDTLKVTDPLRGNVYLAVGHFLVGAYEFENEGPVGAVVRLQKVFQFLDEAEKIAPNDPELNLLTGYMELLLAVNLPFSTPDQAIQKLQANAAPSYLVSRGIAVAYRDLAQYDRALDFVEEAEAATPDNPEIAYLKGQILYKKGDRDQNIALVEEAITHFASAVEKEEQLPTSILKPLKRELRKARKWITEHQSDLRNS